jgi:hypothetical protein
LLKLLHSPPLFLSNLCLVSLLTGQVWTILWGSEPQWTVHKRQNVPDETYPFLPVHDQVQITLQPLSSVTQLWTLVTNFSLI